MHESGFFAEKLEAFGDAPALILESGEVISYRDLAARADEFSRSLGETRKLLLLESRNQLESVVAYLGALRGRHPVIMAPEGSLEKDPTVVATFQPEVIFRFQAGTWRLLRQNSAALRLHGDLAVLLSTSGSTGSAKLVRLSRDNINANARSIASYLELTSSERPITSLPIHYSYGLSVLNSHLSVGACVVLTELSVSEEAFWGKVAAQKVTSIAGVPYTYEIFERLGIRNRSLPHLRSLTQAGGRLGAELVKSYANWAREKSIKFFVMYGQTEATARIAYLPPHLAATHSDCIGVPIPDGKLVIENERGEEIVGTNVVGELVYNGPNVMLGYATAREHLGLGREVHSLRTGDLALRTDENLFRITGRTSRFSKLFGLRIGFDEIEKELRARKLEAYVTGNDQLIAIYITTAVAHAEIVAALVDKYQLPESCFEVIGGSPPPQLSSGKIDYRSILSAAQAARQASSAIAGTGIESKDTTERIIAAFRTIRTRSRATPSDSFIGLGGDSLNFVEVSLALERVLGSVPRGWEKLTIAELAALGNRERASMVVIPTDVFIRALAILGVIATHVGGLHAGGGAYLLFVVSGFNFARFQSTHLFAGKAAQVARTFLLNIVLPYYAVIFAYFALRRSPDIASFFLVSNLFGRFGSFLEPFWYIEALTQVALLTCLAFAAPTLRKVALRNPWATCLGFVAAAACSRLLLPDLANYMVYANRLPQRVLILFALGWLMFFSTTFRQKLVFTGILLVIASFFYTAMVSHFAWLVAGALLIVWVPHVSLPRLIGTVFSMIGGCSYYIYLTHIIVVAGALRFVPRFALPVSWLVAPPVGFAARWAWHTVMSAAQKLFPSKTPQDAAADAKIG
ncbi:MAG: AMP-dependent synthetase [Verrucomicrobia bacterium]|nr:AMP-dependent synthetase [Verrucomicrobiota bacterium]